MKVFSLATLTLKRNKKQYMIYGLTLIFAIVIHLIFSEFINNPYLIEADRARGSSWSGYTIINGITLFNYFILLVYDYLCQSI